MIKKIDFVEEMNENITNANANFVVVMNDRYVLECSESNYLDDSLIVTIVDCERDYEIETIAFYIGAPENIDSCSGRLYYETIGRIFEYEEKTFR